MWSFISFLFTLGFICLSLWLGYMWVSIGVTWQIDLGSFKFLKLRKVCAFFYWWGGVIYLLLSLESRVGNSIYSTGIRLYNILTILIVFFVSNSFHNNSLFRTLFIVLGKHSANMYWTHQFIFYFWFPNIIFFPKNPIAIFFLLLTISLFVSFSIEKLKIFVGFYRFQDGTFKSISLWLQRKPKQLFP